MSDHVLEQSFESLPVGSKFYWPEKISIPHTIMKISESVTNKKKQIFNAVSSDGKLLFIPPKTMILKS